jgi:hypothetical protein
VNTEVLRRFGRLVRQRPTVGLGVAGLLLIIVWGVLPSRSDPAPKRGEAAATAGKDAPRLLSPDVQQQGEVHRLREEVGRLHQTLQDLRQQLDKDKAPRPAPPTKSPDDLGRLFGDVPRVPPASAPPRPAAPPVDVRAVPPAAEPPAPMLPPLPAPPPPPRLTHFKFKTEGAVAAPAKAPAPAPAVRTVHLPAGSFVSATLLSGVYAPVRGTQPLPVLLHFNEAAYAPNRYRVPVDRCVAIAKAVGDYVSRRAILQLDQISCTLPSGRVFTTPIAGWMNGPDGLFGVPGEIIEHTGPFLAKVALSAFIQGGAAGLAQAEATITTTPLGGTQHTVTGNTAQYAALSGLSTTAERMARFFERQVESLVPVIFVKAGATGAVAIQSSVTIEGLSLVEVADAGESPWQHLD